MPRRFFPAPGFGLAALLMAMAFVTGCASQARSTAVRTESRPAQKVEEYKADEFVGLPIVGDYDEDRNLDFILEVADKERTFKIKVHEEYGETNGEVLEKIRNRINNAVDTDRIRVIGYYNSEYKGPEKEYGFMDLKTIVFYDEKSGYEEAYFTDDKGSRFYDEGDVTIVYAPGHHYRNVYYPRYCSPWWDNDGDGIPNAYDPWPSFYDVWYDYNLNGFPDWYDPYYCSVYPYWRHWDMGFWVSYNWYSPSYFRSYRHHPGLYYDDYGAYSRLYDHRLEGRDGRAYRLSPNTNDYSKDLDPKRQWRNEQVHGGGRDVVRGNAATLGGETDRYERLAVDRRRLAPVNTTSRTGGSDVASNVTSSATGGADDRTFTRNRNLRTGSNSGYTGRERTTNRTGDTPDLTKTKAPEGVSGTDARQTPGGGRERDYTPSRGSSGSDNRVYSPSTRERTVGGESAGTNASSANRTTRTASRERTSGRTTAPSDYSTTSSPAGTRSATESRYRGSYVTSRSRGGYTTPSSSGSSPSGGSDSGYSTPSRERSSSGGSYTPSSSGSRGGSYTPSSGGSRGGSAPAASSPSSSGGSRTAPAASQPSSGGSRSRDSGSSSSGSSSRGGSRERK